MEWWGAGEVFLVKDADLESGVSVGRKWDICEAVWGGVSETIQQEWIEVYDAGGMDGVFGRLTDQTIELQTVETVEGITCPIGRADCEDVELLSTFFNMDSAEKGVGERRFSGIKDVFSCDLNGIRVVD